MSAIGGETASNSFGFSATVLLGVHGAVKESKLLLTSFFNSLNPSLKAFFISVKAPPVTLFAAFPAAPCSVPTTKFCTAFEAADNGSPPVAAALPAAMAALVAILAATGSLGKRSFASELRPLVAAPVTPPITAPVNTSFPVTAALVAPIAEPVKALATVESNPAVRLLIPPLTAPITAPVNAPFIGSPP